MMKIRFFLCISMAAVLWASSAMAFTDYSADLDFKTIRERYHKGQISREDYLVSSLKSAFKPMQTLPGTKSVSVGPGRNAKNLTLLLKQAVQSYKTLTPEAREVVDKILMRPDSIANNWPWDSYTDFYLPGTVETFEPTTGVLAGKYKFWYVTHSDPDGEGVTHTTTTAFRDLVVAAFEESYAREVTDMGYPEPPPDTDASDNGGDGLIDVYIMNCGFYDVYGYTASESIGLGTSVSSYMVVDNDFEEFATFDLTATEAMQVTVAHEFHHAIQYGINFYVDDWIMEATSAWMESQVYPLIGDNLQYLNGSSGFFAIPEESLDSDAQLYSAWIFLEYMTILWGSPDVVRDVWGYLENINGGTTAINNAIIYYGSDLKTTFTGFAQKNYSQTDFYPAAGLYDEVAMANGSGQTLDYSTDQSHLIDISNISLRHLAAKYYKFRPGLAGGEDGDSLMLQVQGTENRLLTASVTVKYTDDSFTTYNISLDSTNQGYVTLDGFNQASISEAVLVLVNYSPSTSALNARIYGGLDVAPSSDLGGSNDTQYIVLDTGDGGGGCFISSSIH